jgi:AcrR family transcriptional regulator
MDHNSLAALPSTPLDARMVRTRAALRDALLFLLERKPFDQITIREIAAQSGTGYATFFRHYETKGELLNDIAAAEISALMKLALPVLFVEADSRASARMLCTYVDERRALWSALLTGGAAGTMREEFVRQTRLVPPQPATHSAWLPDDLKVIYGVSATVEVLAWWLQAGNDFAVDQVAEIIDRLIILPTVTGDNG